MLKALFWRIGLISAQNIAPKMCALIEEISEKLGLPAPVDLNLQGAKRALESAENLMAAAKREALGTGLQGSRGTFN